MMVEQKEKNHLFVIINDDNELVPIEYFGLLVSSHREKLKFSTNVALDKSAKNGLKKDSIVKCDYIYKIPKKNIQFKIGQVDIDDYIRFMEVYSEVLERLSKEIENT